jgi:hypothetical protein
MTMNRTRGEVPFPFFGGEDYLRYRTGDLVQLRQKYGENYREVIMTGLAKFDPLVMIDCLRHGLKIRNEAGEEKVKRLLSAQEDDLPFNPDEVQMAFANALMLAWTGKTYEQIEAERAAALAEHLESLDGEGEASPPAMSSSASTPSALEQASTLTPSID